MESPPPRPRDDNTHATNTPPGPRPGRPPAGDADSLAAWSRICEASRREFEALYVRLGVTLSERGESFYNPMLKVRVLGCLGF